jgi:hypothetical protein
MTIAVVVAGVAMEVLPERPRTGAGTKFNVSQLASARPRMSTEQEVVKGQHQGRLFGDTKWDGKEFHGREWIDYGLCGTKGKRVTGTTRDREKA